MAESGSPNRQFQYATMAMLMRSSAVRHPKREALIVNDVHLTFADLDTRTDRLAEALRARGLRRGSVIGTLLHDGVAMVELLIATAKLGSTILAMNWRLASGELAYIMADGNPALCFVSQCFAGLATDADPTRRTVVIGDDPSESACDALGLSDGSPRLSTCHHVEPIDRWYMLYSSGTTGHPKGCQHSQGGYYINTLAMIGALGIDKTDRFLLTSSLFHVGGLSNFLSRFVAGSCTVIAPRHLPPEALLRLVSEKAITTQVLPKLQVEEYLAAQRRLGLPLKLRLVMAGAGMLHREQLEEIREVLGADMALGYGQSEIGGFASFIGLEEQLERPSCCGTVMPHLETRLIDDCDRDVREGDRGELLLRGATVMLGYLNLPEANDAAFVDGWLRTGDIFWRDPDGFLHFAGRTKELVKSGGENVYPAEVERLLATHPAIADACIVGVPDPRWGEAVKAFVVLKPGRAVSPIEIALWCRQSIAGYKRPRFVQFVNEIPRNAQGKPHRMMLRACPTDASQSTDPVSAA